MNDVRIEKATERDRPRIMELLQQANMHRIPSPEMPSMTYENYRVAVIDGFVVGFCGFRMLSATEGKTELMVVDRTLRRSGVGIMLQVARMEEMLARGALFVTTNADLPATIEWYKRHFGYREVGTIPKLHEFGDPDIDHWTTLRADLKSWDEERRLTVEEPRSGGSTEL